MSEPQEHEEIQGELQPRQRKVVVRYDHLPPSVQESIDALHKMRVMRVFTTPTIMAFSPVAAFVPVALAKAVGKPLLPATLFAIAAVDVARRGVVVPNAQIVRQTKLVAEKIGKNGLVARDHSGKYNFPEIAKLRETHPLMLVDRNGNVHLIPKSYFEEALAKAQGTFLKHLLPYRKREIY